MHDISAEQKSDTQTLPERWPNHREILTTIRHVRAGDITPEAAADYIEDLFFFGANDTEG